MRAHKYRVWHQTEHKMVYFSLGELLGNYCDEFNYCALADTDLYRWHDADDLETMQYTGIKDCKGTEIYEGDIVKWKIFPEDKDPTYIMDAVVYRGGAFALEKRIELLGGIAPYRKLEVIGNIYQHCELMKGEEEQ